MSKRIGVQETRSITATQSEYKDIATEQARTLWAEPTTQQNLQKAIDMGLLDQDTAGKFKELVGAV